MKKVIFLILFSLTVIQNSSSQESNISIYTFEEFAPILQKNNDTLYIINFWATWCKPCVVELPHFERINKEYKEENVKVILVSLDFQDELETRLKPFIEKKKIKSEVILLNESDPNTFINKVSTKWSGAIPASYIYKGNKVDFYEKSFTYEELVTIIKKKLSNYEE